MAGTFDKYQEALNGFNTKYGVDFSFEKYETQVLKYKNLQSAFVSRSKSKPEDLVYRGMFTSLFRECVDNMVERKIGMIDYVDLLGDFDALMDNYREFCKENGKEAPNKKGGWKSDVQVIEAIQEKIKDVKTDIGEYTKEKYLSGKLRLRDMRATLDTMKSGNTVSVDQIATVITYQKALRSTVDNRSFFWKVFHPIRNSAEQRDLKAVEVFLDGNRSKNPLEYSKAMLLAAEKTVYNINANLERAKENLKANAPAEAQKKERIDVSKDVNANVNENKNLSKVEEHKAPKLENVKQ